MKGINLIFSTLYSISLSLSANPKGFISSFLNIFKTFYPDSKISLSKYLAPHFEISQKNITGQKVIEFFSVDSADSEHFMVGGIKLMQGTNANIDATDWQNGISDSALKNGIIKIQNAGSLEITSIPLTAFLQSINNADLDAGTLILTKPFLWVGKTKIVITVTLPIVNAVSNMNLRIELIGNKLV